MNLDDFEIEDLDEEEESDTLLNGSGSSAKAKSNVMKVLFIIGINIIAVLLVIIVLVIVGFIKGKFQIVKEGNGGSDLDKPKYTEVEMQNMVATAKAEAKAEQDAEVDAAYNNGYSVGSNYFLDYLKDTLMSNNSSLQTFNLLYPDHMVVVSNGRYNFLPIDRSLAQSTLTLDQLRFENGEMTIVDENNTVVSYKGIDVSEYQGNINWSKVAADGVDFAIMRSHYRGYGTGRLVRDAQIDANLKGAIDNGIHVGVYVFSQAINREEAIEEAEAAIESLAPYATNVPIIIDVERVAGAKPRMDALSVEERTDVILTFCDTVREAGYIPMIYYNTEMGALYVDLTRLEGITKWYAWYGEWLYFPYEYDIWQYKDTGKVNGINGNVDMNVALKPFW